MALFGGMHVRTFSFRFVVVDLRGVVVLGNAFAGICAVCAFRLFFGVASAHVHVYALECVRT